MQAFEDLDGREWRISINAATVERVRETLDVDLYEYGMHGEHEDLRQCLQFQVRGNPVLLCKILYQLCLRQAAEAHVDWESFAEAVSDQPLWDALRAMETEIANFTVSPDRRAAVTAAIEKMGELMDSTHKWVRQKTLQAVADPRIAQQHANELAKLDERFGKMQESLASTDQTPTPTAS